MLPVRLETFNELPRSLRSSRETDEDKTSGHDEPPGPDEGYPAVGLKYTNQQIEDIKAARAVYPDFKS